MNVHNTRALVCLLFSAVVLVYGTEQGKASIEISAKGQVTSAQSSTKESMMRRDEVRFNQSAEVAEVVYMIAAGCASKVVDGVNVPGAPMCGSVPGQKNLDPHAVRCCDGDKKKLKHFKYGCGKSGKGATKAQKEKCQKCQHLTWTEANEHCKNYRNARNVSYSLCTVQQLEARNQCGAGCQLNNVYVWTSDECSPSEKPSEKPSDKPSEKRSAPSEDEDEDEDEDEVQFAIFDGGSCSSMAEIDGAFSQVHGPDPTCLCSSNNMTDITTEADCRAAIEALYSAELSAKLSVVTTEAADLAPGCLQGNSGTHFIFYGGHSHEACGHNGYACVCKQVDPDDSDDAEEPEDNKVDPDDSDATAENPEDPLAAKKISEDGDDDGDIDKDKEDNAE